MLENVIGGLIAGAVCAGALLALLLGNRLGRLAGTERERPGRGRKATQRRHWARTIKAYIARHNVAPRPFVWTADLKDSLPKIMRAHAALDTIENR